MSEKNLPSPKRPEKVIRKGSVTGEIHLKQSPDGFRYLDFSLVRTFRYGTDRELRSTSFFDLRCTLFAQNLHEKLHADCPVDRATIKI